MLHCFFFNKYCTLFKHTLFIVSWTAKCTECGVLWICNMHWGLKHNMIQCLILIHISVLHSCCILFIYFAAKVAASNDLIAMPEGTRVAVFHCCHVLRDFVDIYEVLQWNETCWVTPGPTAGNHISGWCFVVSHRKNKVLRFAWNASSRLPDESDSSSHPVYCFSWFDSSKHKHPETNT